MATLRILDANANRASEGLRVIEEYVRFALDDAFLAGLCKQLRHELTAVLSRLLPQSTIAARDSERDVGAALSTSSEFHRHDLLEVAIASCKRVQQSLRCLEEYVKPVTTQDAQLLELLRYRAYTLEKAVRGTAESRERLAAIRLCVLIDGGQNSDEFTRRAQALISAGVHMLQLRDKLLDDRALVERARHLRSLTRGTGTLFIVNDRADVAAVSHADGVHVGQTEMSVKDARSIVGPNPLVGVSTHSLDEARRAVSDGASYLGCGPTFPSDTKSFASFPGPDLLRAVAAEITLPAFAIGGISPASLQTVLDCGFTRIAVGSAVARAPDPATIARELIARLH